MEKHTTCFGILLVFSVLLILSSFSFMYRRWHFKPVVRQQATKTWTPGSTRHLHNYTSVLVHDVIWRNYTAAGKRQFFIYSVIASKSDRGRDWDHVVVNGWEIPSAINVTYKCCFFYGGGRVGQTESTEKRQFSPHARRIEARQVVCRYPDDKKPERFGLVLLGENCPSAESQQTITYPQVDDGMFTICGKIAYGDKNPLHLIEWIEYQLYFGADKIVLYPYQDLNAAAIRVLRFYAANDVIEIVPMPFVPELDKWPRHFRKHGSGEMYNDEQVSMFDAQSRLRYYRYLAVFDTDEFPAPNRNIAKSYWELMHHMTTAHPKDGTFIMLTHFYSLSYNQTDPSSELLIGRYGTRTQAILNRNKMIHIPERIVPGTVWIHGAVPKEGYSRGTAKETEVVLKHYRTCSKDWLEPSPESKLNKCFSGFQLQNDDYMKSIAATIGPNVRKVKEILGLRAEKDSIPSV